jgi:hypothetical protein
MVQAFARGFRAAGFRAALERARGFAISSMIASARCSLVQPWYRAIRISCSSFSCIGASILEL